MAYSTVAVKSRIAGQLFKVSFQEGQDVRKGDLLFTIDPRPFEGALKQAEANLARDQFQAKNAEADAARYEALFKQGIIARQQFEQFRSSADALRAQTAADEAAIRTAPSSSSRIPRFIRPSTGARATCWSTKAT